MGTIVVEVDNLYDMTHQATARDFTFRSDEPTTLGGEDASPTPLEYFSAGLAMCVLTQLVAFSRLLRIDLDAASCAVTSHWGRSGSVKAGTVQSRSEGIELHVEAESSEDPEEVAHLLHLVESGCYAHAALRSPVEVVTRATLGGRPLTLGAPTTA